jgi:hypothetical protein
VQNPQGIFTATKSSGVPVSSTAKWGDLRTMAAQYGFQVE